MAASTASSLCTPVFTAKKQETSAVASASFGRSAVKGLASSSIFGKPLSVSALKSKKAYASKSAVVKAEIGDSLVSRLLAKLCFLFGLSLVFLIEIC